MWPSAYCFYQKWPHPSFIDKNSMAEGYLSDTWHFTPCGLAGGTCSHSEWRDVLTADVTDGKWWAHGHQLAGGNKEIHAGLHGFKASEQGLLQALACMYVGLVEEREKQQGTCSKYWTGYCRHQTSVGSASSCQCHRRDGHPATLRG